MRCLGHISSISTVYQASRPLRTQLRPLHRNTFFAVCWLMVLAPRRRPPRACCSRAFSIASRSKPRCSAKRWSSAAIAASGNAGAIRSRSRHWYRSRKSSSPSSHAESRAPDLTIDNGGSTNRSVATCTTLSSTSATGSISKRRSQRRHPRWRLMDASAACTPGLPSPYSTLPVFSVDAATIIAAPPPRARHEPMSESRPDTDRLDRFLLPQAAVRGVRVHLGETWSQIRARVDELPEQAATLLGEAAAAAALFTAHVKVDGRLSVHLRSEGALRTLFAECTANGTLRGIVRLAEGTESIPGDLRKAGEGATLAITIENPAHGQREPVRYQGLVAMASESLAGALEDCCVRSEPLPTRILL